MTLVDQVVKAIQHTGESFAKDLWDSQDIETLRYVSGRLVRLEEKAKNALTDEERDDYREQINQWLDHLEVLALSRINVAQNKLRENLERSFCEVLLNGVSPYLGTVVFLMKDRLS